MNPGRVVALAVTFGFGSLSALIAVLVVVQRVRLLTLGAQGMGTVVDAFVSTTTDLRTKAGSQPLSPIVEVTDRSTGQPFRFRSWFGSSVTSATIGAQVPVRYLPGDSDMAELDTLTAMWMPPLLFGLAGAVLLVCGYFLWLGYGVT